MKKFQMIASAVLCCAMAACGGGSDDNTTDANTNVAAATDTTAPAGTNTGSVSAPFVRSSAARYFILGANSQTFGALTASTQDGNGVMTTLNDTTLGGASVTKEISGNASLAQGRWVAGTMTNSSGTKTLTGTDNQAYHYVAFNNLSAMPTTGAAACGTGAFTAPTRTESSTSGANAGTATGTASVVFGTSSATVTGTITATAGGSVGTASLNTSVASTSSIGMTGSFLSSGPGAGVAIGTDGGAGYVVVAAYTVRLADGNLYRGVANFRCS